nr:MAG TPA: hypothetical protein [Bacteriophage sp.]
MLFSVYESMLLERLQNVESKTSHTRNFIVGECFGIVRTAMADNDVSFDEATILWDMLAIQLQRLSKDDFTENLELRDNMRDNMRMYELCLSAVDDSLMEYVQDGHNREYCQGVIDGLVMYCDIYCNYAPELEKIKRKRNKILYSKS